MFKDVFKLSIFAAVVPFSAHANLERLATEFLKSNTEINTAKVNLELSKINVKAVPAAKTWSLALASEHEDSSKKSGFTYNALDSQSTSHTLSLSKDFMFGGNLSLASIYTNSQGSDFGGSTKVYGFDQTLTYTQDLGANFLGRNDRLDLAIAEKTYESQKEGTANVIESGLFDFSSKYLQAKLNNSLLELTKKAESRAKKRESLIRRRVKDGLREKVDLYSAQASLFAATEEVKNAQMNLEGSLENISNSLHRPVVAHEVGTFDLEDTQLSTVPFGKVEDNKQFLVLERNIKTVQAGLKQASNNLMPTVQLEASYSTNEFDTTSSTAISDGKLGGDNSAYTVGVTATWAIGSKPQKLERAKYRIQLKDAEYKKKKVYENFKNTEVTLISKLESLDSNIESAKKRRDLSFKAYKEYNRLYNRGRTDLDQLIRSEENLINTEKSYASYIAQRETYVFALSRLYGKLQDLIISEKE